MRYTQREMLIELQLRKAEGLVTEARQRMEKIKAGELTLSYLADIGHGLQGAGTMIVSRANDEYINGPIKTEDGETVCWVTDERGRFIQ